MSQRVVFLNGAFVPEREAKISLYDSALNLGDMVYEVTRTCHHRPFRLAEHLERLYHSLAAVEIDPGVTPAELERLTLETLARNLPSEPADVDWQIIHNISRGPAAGFEAAFVPGERRPTIAIHCFPLVEKLGHMAAAFVQGIDLVIVGQRAIPGTLLNQEIKTRSRLHYQLANLEARRRRATAILIDPDGYLTEGTSGNLFVIRSGELFTPARGNLLPGITRGLVLQLAGEIGVPAHESKLTVDAARTADELFITSTSIGIVHARSFEGATIGRGMMGPITARLRSALVDEVGVDFAAQAALYAGRIAK